MPKIRRIILPGVPHHITQRGNRRVKVFADARDYALYLNLLRTYSTRHGLSFAAYCLMPNHIHLVAVPAEPWSISRTLRDTHRLYARLYNNRHGYVGHLWQGRFFSCGLDDRHFWAAVRYVERNPLKAGLASRAEDYPWSSARSHCRERPISDAERRSDEVFALSFPSGSWIRTGREWSAWLSGEDEEKALEAIRKETLTGRPCGSEEFLKQIEQRLGKLILRKKPGRKKRDPGGREK